jgi:hypothetical protein
MKEKKKRSRHLTAEEAEALFSTLDETGHVDPSVAAEEHANRRANRAGLRIDPLSGKDPSGSNVNEVIKRAAITFVVAILVAIILAQVSCGVARRVSTANLGEEVNVKTVTSAMKGGVEWGGGFTQFPSDFSVQEADEATGRIEVSVVDTSSTDVMDLLSANQIQASALAVNAFMNQHINTVVYHVYVHVDDAGNIQKTQWFGMLEPAGAIKNLMTFVWTKSEAADGTYNWTSSITGIDEETYDSIKDKLGPFELFSTSTGGSGKTVTTVDSETVDKVDADAGSTTETEAQPAS